LSFIKKAEKVEDIIMFVNALYKFAFKRNYFDDNNFKKTY